jgi:hypothetical protein
MEDLEGDGRIREAGVSIRRQHYLLDMVCFIANGYSIRYNKVTKIVHVSSSHVEHRY